ncbi:hypothetical protein TD95_003887 [Thielaviopsis punctulata]|uniref:RRM domain-containing protein n=1 Tax=Thielaviopsis punctulata TaxID=72032 RepID=A0A0F4ZGK9_9PEZI|nr:hypothetical protein TD95_003887 [Thielaviopsis punctulata]
MTAAQTKVVRPGPTNANTSAGTSNQQPAKTGSRGGRGRNQQSGVMVKIRLLPPGLQEAEYLKLLPTEWHEGNGKVDYARYTPGKVSGRPGKPSQGSVAYLHLGKEEEVVLLSETVKQIVWEDAADTFSDPCLKAKPYLERCAYRKNPSGKQRTDSLQGDIDQDPEFIAFLESLTQTAPKDKEEDKSIALAAEVEKAVDKTKITTPLIEFMREKREKDREGGASGRSGRGARQEAKSARSRGDEKKRSRDKDHDSKDKEKAKDKSNKLPDKIKILKKNPDSTADASGRNSALSNGAGESAPVRSKNSEIAAAARALQRDFGLGPGAAHRRAKAEFMKAEACKAAAVNGPNGKNEVSKEPVAAAAAAAGTIAAETSKLAGGSATGSKRDPARTRGRGKGKNATETSKSQQTQQMLSKPIILLKKKPETPTPDETTASLTTPKVDASPQTPVGKSHAEKQSVSTPVTHANASSSKGKSSEKSNKERKSEKSGGKGSNAAPAVAISPGATQAFVKHVNASHGIDESSLRIALSTFGAINSLEIDRRKGFAYVEFSQHESLVAASRMSQIPIGQGHVQVTERRDKKPAVANGNAAGPSSLNLNDKGKTVDAKDVGKDRAKAERAKKSEKGDKPDKGEKGEKGEKTEKSGSRRSRGRRGGGGGKGSTGNKDGGNANGGGEKPSKASGGQAAAVAGGSGSVDTLG